MPKISIELRGREKEMRKKIDSKSRFVGEAIQKAGINPLEVLVKINGKFVPDIEKVRDGDKVELLQITSRG